MSSVAYSDPTTHPHWVLAVREVQACAHLSLPDNIAHIDKAVELVLFGLVHPLEERGYYNVSRSDGSGWYKVNGECACADAVNRQVLCKHRLAVAIYRRALSKLDAMLESVPQEKTPAPKEDCVVTQTAHTTIPKQFIKIVHGKEFVIYEGLLAMAHERGLKSLEATFISVTEKLALAEATAVFDDGRKFTESADATPGNVQPGVRPHFARMALTRSKARCLRDALNIGMCAVEEIGDE